MNEELGMKVAASPRSRAQVAAVLAFVISRIPAFKLQGSGFKVQGCGAAHKNIEAPRRFETSGFLVSHP